MARARFTAHNGAMGSLRMPAAAEALRDRDEPMRVPPRHTVLGTPLLPPFPEGSERAVFGMGCFWGAERKFWELDGVYTTAVGYAGGYTKNPTYREVCSGGTGHAEVVLVVYDKKRVSYAERSEEHTSELQSPCNLVCRLLLEKKKTPISILVWRWPSPRSEE